MLVTNHWAASPPVRLRAYHVEIARTGDLSADLLHTLRALTAQPGGHALIPWETLYSLFTIWKNDDLSTATSYGTWDINTDPRDGSSDIEVASMCMVGATTTNFGSEPFTIAHAWMHIGVCARICHLKGLNPLATFDTGVEPSVLENGPIHVISTHGERAAQTIDYGVPGGAASSAAASSKYGYFVGSGDPDSRWDLAVLDPGYLADGQTVSVEQARASAELIRQQTNSVLLQGAFYDGMWGLD